MSTRSLINLVILTFLLSGCANIDSIFKKSPPAKRPNPTQKAELLKTQGNYLAAANEYLRLAKSASSTAKPRYRLAAVQNLLKVGMTTEAKAELAKVNVSQNRNLEPYFQLMQAQIAMAEGRIESASLRLQVVNPNALSTELRRQYYEMQIQVLEAKGDIWGAVANRVQLHSILSAEAKSENQDKLWQSLMKVNIQELRIRNQELGIGGKNTASPDPRFPIPDSSTFQGWIALALLYKTTHPKHFQQVLSDWQAQFPNHPATQGMIQNLSSTLPATADLGSKQIALLLPFNSRRKAYAEATYRGFMAASYADGGNANIKVYDVNPDTIVQVYQKVLSDGADFVVGPLQKKSIENLLNSQVKLLVPTLALNVSRPDLSLQNFYQFSLSPEDQAHNIATKMWADGHRTAAVLAPRGKFGERVSNAFRYMWSQRGGQLIANEFYGKKVENAVNKILQQKNDINAIFMVASPKYGKQIRAFFKYYNVENLPTYSTSHIYSGENLPRQNAELDGIIFGDMPWRIAPTQRALKLQSNFQRFWPDSIPQFSSLYAFGVDAYHLLSQLGYSSGRHFGFQWDGQTGRLLMDENGIVHREWVHWAKFVNGVPHLLDANAPSPDDSTIPDIMQQDALIKALEGLLAE